MKAALLSALAAYAVASPLLEVRDSVTAVVDLSNNTGTPQHLAAGLLYGVPNNGNQIPSKFYTEMGVNYIRAGGAQIPAPGRGWIWGLNEYKNRYATVLDNYKTARQYGAQFIFLIHDLWGADGTQNSSAPYPGDNGNWSYWDQYLAQVTSDMRKNGMTSNIIIDIWNEPDGSGFWNRNQDQYLQMWGRTYYYFRKTFGTDVLLSGPATAGEPLNNGWWNNWCSFVASNGSVPDQYAWHMEGGGGDMLSAYGGLVGYLNKYNLPLKQVNINEYGVYNEQVPAGSAWWIAQLERVNARGLRGNWLSGWQLHDFLASLLGKPNADNSNYSPTGTGYYPNGDWQTYKYYSTNMTGHRVGSQPSGDLALDVYGTVGTDLVRLLVGVRLQKGTWELQVDNLSAVGLPTSGSLNIHTWGFPVGSDAHYSEVDGPQDLGYYSHDYSGNSVTFPIYNTDTNRAYAFEFSPGS